MISKLKKNDGYTLGLAIAILVITTLVAFILHNYSMNQLRTTKNNQKYVQNKYILDGVIEEEVVSDFINRIDIVKQNNRFEVSNNKGLNYFETKFPFDSQRSNTSPQGFYNLDMNSDKGGVAINTKKIVLVTANAKLEDDSQYKKEFLIEVKGKVETEEDLANVKEADKPLYRNMKIRVCVDKIYQNFDKSITYDISYHTIEVNNQKNNL